MPEGIRRMFCESSTMKLSQCLAFAPLDPALIWRVDSALQMFSGKIRKQGTC